MSEDSEDKEVVKTVSSDGIGEAIDGFLSEENKSSNFYRFVRDAILILLVAGTPEFGLGIWLMYFVYRVYIYSKENDIELVKYQRIEDVTKEEFVK